MKIYTFNKLSKHKLQSLCARDFSDDFQIENQVAEIISNVKSRGDAALKQYAQTFDGIDLEQLKIENAALESLANQIDPEVKDAINTAYHNIWKFHESQLQIENKIETMPGVRCWRENRAIERVGLYIPGGTAVLPSTFLMLAIPARIAGCNEIVVCTPPLSNGSISIAIAYCAKLLQISSVYTCGGAQAIAAMAYGTQTIPKVDKIFGPGNRFVTTAKLQIQNTVAIDLPAGPSEVLIIANETANPSYLASDLLAQAEHGADSQCILVSNSSKILDLCKEELSRQIKNLPRKSIAKKALENSFFVHTQTLEEAFNFSNEYAPEHLIIALHKPQTYIPLISNAGSVFLGNLTPESAGDYASGTNHTLPTRGFAKSHSGVSVDSFVKKITFQEINQQGLQLIGPTIMTLASEEGLFAHKNSINIRL